MKQKERSTNVQKSGSNAKLFDGGNNDFEKSKDNTNSSITSVGKLVSFDSSRDYDNLENNADFTAKDFEANTSERNQYCEAKASIACDNLENNADFTAKDFEANTSERNQYCEAKASRDRDNLENNADFTAKDFEANTSERNQYCEAKASRDRDNLESKIDFTAKNFEAKANEGTQYFEVEASRDYDNLESKVDCTAENFEAKANEGTQYFEVEASRDRDNLESKVDCTAENFEANTNEGTQYREVKTSRDFDNLESKVDCATKSFEVKVNESTQYFEVKSNEKIKNFKAKTKSQHKQAKAEKTKGKFSKKRKLGIMIASIATGMALLLGGVFGLSTALQAKSSVTTNNDMQQNDETASVDFGYLVDKYQEYFVVNENGTVSLELNSHNKVRSTEIDANDIDAMNAYSDMLDNINPFIEDGTFYIADDGNYYITELDKQKGNRDINGGVNDFYVRTESHKVLFWWVSIPVGYTLKLSVKGALIFGAISAIAALGTGFLVSQSTFINFFVGMTAIAVSVFHEIGVDGWLYDLMVAIYISQVAIATAISVLAPGVGSVVSVVIKAVIAILATLVWNTFGESFLHLSAQNYYTSNNTIVCDANLLFMGRDFYATRE